MRKLLSANFYRLWKSKIFWLLEGICFLFGVINYALVAVNTKNLGQGWLEHNAHSYFYLPQVLVMVVVIAVFTSFFIGADYSDGTIRNKLAVGHSRETFYLSCLVTTAAAELFFLSAFLLPVFLIGIPFSGSAVITCVSLQPWRIINILLFLMEYTSLFVLLTLLDSYKARNVLICLMAAVVLILLGIVVYGRYMQPEFVDIVTALPDGGVELKQGIPNGKYLTGTLRTIFEWFTLLLPSGSIMFSLDKNLGFDWRCPALALLITLLLTRFGIRLFRKKDIR